MSDAQPGSERSAGTGEEVGVRGQHWLQRILEAETAQLRLPAAGGDLWLLMSVSGPPVSTQPPGLVATPGTRPRVREPPSRRPRLPGPVHRRLRAQPRAWKFGGERPGRRGLEAGSDGGSPAPF